MQQVKMRRPQTVTTVIFDPDAGKDIKYTARPLSRSIKRRIGDLAEKQTEVVLQLADATGDSRHELEDQFTRLRCDQLNVLLAAQDDAPPAGDVLFDAYENERISDNEIEGLWTDINEALEPDPTGLPQ